METASSPRSATNAQPTVRNDRIKQKQAVEQFPVIITLFFTLWRNRLQGPAFKQDKQGAAISNSTGTQNQVGREEGKDRWRQRREQTAHALVPHAVEVELKIRKE